MPDLYSLATPEVPSADLIRKSDVIELSSKMRPSGSTSAT